MQVTFALKAVCGLAVAQIATGLLCEPAAIAQRLVRARRQLAASGIAIEPPPPEALAERAGAVRTALYLMFNEGCSASSGDALVPPWLCVEAVRLARALAGHPMTAGPASDALAALLAPPAARLSTRVGPDGVAQLLDDQPREQWDGALIATGLARLDRSAAGEELTAWHLRAEIAALHATAASGRTTDWPRIGAIYDHLIAIDPSPVTALARAVAIGRAHGAGAGLAALPTLAGSPYAHAAAGVFLAELGQVGAARIELGRALAFARTEPERRLTERRLAALPTSTASSPARSR